MPAKSSIGASAVQLISTATPFAVGLVVKAAAANTGKVYVAPSSAVTANSADATDGYELSAGETLFISPGEMKSLSLAADASLVYVIGSTTGQKVFWKAF